MDPSPSSGLPVISPNLRDISTPFGFVETKKRDAVLWKQDSFYPVPCFQVRFKRWQDCATLLVPNPRTCCRSSPAVYESSCKGLSCFRLTSKSQAARFMSELSITGFTDNFYSHQDNQQKYIEAKMETLLAESLAGAVKYCGFEVGLRFTSALRVLRAR